MATPVDLSKFKEVKFTMRQVHMSGGALTKSTPMITKEVGMGQTKEIFVKMSLTEQWLLAATTGQKTYNKSCFDRSTLLDDLRGHVRAACDGEAADQDEEVADDPMNDLEAGDEKASPSKRTRGDGGSRTRYYKNHAANSTVRVTLAASPPELRGHTEYTDGTREVRLFVVDRKVIWLHLSDVAWAVHYLYVQCLLKGVPLVAPDSTGPTEEAEGEA